MASTKKIFSVIPDQAEQLPGNNDKQLLEQTFQQFDKVRIPERLFAKEANLWKSGKKEKEKISDRLGWLTLPDDKKGRVKDITAFAQVVKKAGYKHVVLLGMGGSSLCSEVARETFGSKRGYPKLFVLDDTDPEAIRFIEKSVNIERTLFIVASKSGNTKETLSFFQYFYALAKVKMKDKAGSNFVAITDKDTELVKLGKKHKFRKVFVNPSDIGGRYSVLSDFGLVPMALIGVDIAALMLSAQQMESTCHHAVSASNPGTSLGAEIGLAQQQGRDKLTFILSPSISSFGYWVEQLIAESTGKETKGIIPINGEDVGKPEVYSDDRLFIYIHLAGDEDKATTRKVKALENAGHPVINIGLPDKAALGGEYFCWEFATAIAGVIIGINPFDEPNVAESKKNTENILTEWQKKKAFAEAHPVLKAKDISIYAGGAATSLKGEAISIGHYIDEFKALGGPDHYIALLPYFFKTDERTKVLQAWRQSLRDETKLATTLLHGPRYLHSTGQLHKGGPETGLYIILTAEETNALPIPGEQYGFDILHRAQALGDFRSLSDKGRPVIRIDLGKDIDAGLKELWKQLKKKK